MAVAPAVPAGSAIIQAESGVNQARGLEPEVEAMLAAEAAGSAPEAWPGGAAGMAVAQV